LGEDSSQKVSYNATNTVDGKDVEGIVNTEEAFDVHAGVADEGAYEAESEAGAGRDVAKNRKYFILKAWISSGSVFRSVTITYKVY
jgi:hypothetical protein